MSDMAIRVESLSKSYRIGGPRAHYKTLRESLVVAANAPVWRFRGLPSRKDDTIWALKDLSLEVMRGEAVGVVGRLKPVNLPVRAGAFRRRTAGRWGIS